jgi:hypothetical protein
MYDNYSTDNSIIIAKSLGMEVRMFGKPGELNDQYYLDVKNHCWKEERNKSDYVIVCDADEFLKLDNLKLTSSCPTVKGYNMISNSLPINLITEINTGYEDENYSKQVIFNPDMVREINYVHGCHKNNKIGNITTHDNVKLLHYRMIGGVDRMIERHFIYKKRMSKFNLKHRMGHHYLHESEAKKNEWNYLKTKAKELW